MTQIPPTILTMPTVSPICSVERLDIAAVLIDGAYLRRARERFDINTLSLEHRTRRFNGTQ